MTVGFFSPLPPARTGVADYAKALFEALKIRGKVDLFPARAEVNLYHLGNNQLHRTIYERALQQPGVVVLHDAVLHHFALGYFDRAKYVEEFVFNYGEWSRSLAESLWAGRSRSGADEHYFRYGLLRRIAERSLAVVVHNPAAALAVRQHAPQANVIEIPHLLEQPAFPVNIERTAMLRAGIFGHLREAKRIMPVLRALSRVASSGIELLLAGECSSRDLERAIRPYLEAKYVRRLGYLAGPDFWRAAQSIDVCINLRFPAAGESSGIMIRMMGLAKPVIVTEGLEVSRLPEHACIRIAPGTGEEHALEQSLLWLRQFQHHGRAIGEAAQVHVRQWHSLDRVADLYWDALRAAKAC